MEFFATLMLILVFIQTITTVFWMFLFFRMKNLTLKARFDLAAWQFLDYFLMMSFIFFLALGAVDIALIFGIAFTFMFFRLRSLQDRVVIDDLKAQGRLEEFLKDKK